MELRAIRLKSVGRFRDGVALEGLAPGLNLLAAPNEAGKSTLLRALRAVFEVPHTSRSRKGPLSLLQPSGGGAPLVECEFMLDGVLWRLRKQFLASHSAELRELSGREVFVGADAEQRLEDMLSGPASLKASIDSLWVEQQRGFKPPVLSGEHRRVFQALVQAEVDAAAGSGLLARIQAKVQDDLDQLITRSRRQAKTGGAYAHAQAELAEAREALEVARAKAAQSAARRQRLSELANEERVLADPAIEAERRSAAEAKRAALAKAREARQKAEVAAARRAEAEQVLRAAQGALQRHNTAMAECVAGRDRLDALNRARAELVDEIAMADEHRHGIGARLVEMREAQARAARAEIARERLVRYRSMMERASELSSRIAQAKSVAEALDHARDALSAFTITPKEGREISVLHDDVRVLERAFAAQATQVLVSYDARAVGRFRIDGRSLDVGEELSLVAPTRIVADGIGSLDVKPSAQSGEDVAARLSGARAALAGMLEHCGVTDVSEAEAALAKRAETQREVDDLASRLSALAPDGVSGVSAQHEALLVAADDLVRDAGLSPDEEPELAASQLETAEDSGTLGKALDALEAERTASERRAGELRERLAGMAAESDGLSARLAVVEAQLPGDDAERADVRIKLGAAMEDAQAQLHACVRDHDAWLAAAPEERALQELEAEVAKSEADVRSMAGRLSSLRETRREIEGALRRDVEDGIEAEVALLEERTDRLEEQVRVFEADIAAMTLLAEEAGRGIAAQRAAFAGPIARRMQELATHVFPDVIFELGPDFGIQALVRAGSTESLDRVSEGTQEQVAVLVRLALARCLTEAHGPQPVILDDALVYADDSRLERTFSALQAAAQTHQVLVLSCHQRAFAPLADRFGARDLALEDWRP